MKINIKITLALVMVVLIATTIVSVLSVLTIKTELKEQIINRLSEHAFHTLEKLDRTLFERISDIKMMTSLENKILVSDQFSLSEKLSFLRAIEKEYKVYASISICDVNGIIIGDTRGVGVGDDQTDRPYFKEAIKGNIYSDSKPVFSENLAIPVIHFSAPLRNEAGIIKGVLVTRFPINKINDLVRERGSEYKAKEIMIDLLDKDGLVLFSNHKRGNILKKRLGSMEIFKKVSRSEKRTESLIAIYEGKEVLFLGAK